MAVAYQTSFAGTSSASSSSAVVDLSARFVGELVFVLISRTGDVAPTTTPSGWTLLDNHADTYGHWLYAKTLAAGDIGSVTWEWAASTKTLASAHVYSGHDPVSPITTKNKSGFSYPASLGIAIYPGSINTTLLMLVAFASCYSESSKSWTPAAGYTERYDAGSTTPDFWQTCKDTAGAWGGGASNPMMLISADASYRGGFHVAIKPADDPVLLPALLLTSNGTESDPFVWPNDSPRFDMLDRNYAAGYRAEQFGYEWERYEETWVAAGEYGNSLAPGYYWPETKLHHGGPMPPLPEGWAPYAHDALWRWRGRFSDYAWPEWGYFTFDFEGTAIKVTSHEGTAESPAIITDTTPTIEWHFTKASSSYSATVIDQADSTVHQSTGWVTDDASEHTLAVALTPGESYAVKVEVRDAVQQYSYTADLVFLHVNDAVLLAPELVAEPNCDSVSPIVLEWADPVTTDGDTMMHFNISVRGTTTGGSEVNLMFRSNPVADDGTRADLEIAIGTLSPGSYAWKVQAVDEHEMEGEWSAEDEFTVTRASGAMDEPDPGVHPYYEPTRPLLLEDHAQFVDSAGKNMGLVPARVRFTQRLDGSNTLDQVTVPKDLLLKTGYRETRRDLMSGWEIRYAGQYHTIEDVDADHETETVFRCRSREVWELSRCFSSTSVQPFVRIAKIPNEIMYDLLRGEGDLVIANGGFEDAYPVKGGGATKNIGGESVMVYTEVWVVDGWRLHTYNPSNAGRGGNNPIWGETDNVALPHGFRVFSDAIGSRQHVVRLWRAVPPFVYSVAGVGGWTSDTKETVYLYHPAQLFSGPPGSEFRVTVDARYFDADLMEEVTLQGTRFGVGLLWLAPDRQTVVGYDFVDWSAELVDDAYTTMDSGLITRKGEFFHPCFIIEHDAVEDTMWTETSTPWKANDMGAYAMFIDNMTIYGQGLSQPSNWVYYGNMYTRDADVLHTAEGWIEFGTWTVGESDIHTNIAGNKLVRIVTGQQIVIHFNAGDAGATVQILYDDIVLDPAFDVSGATTYTIDNMDPRREHLIGIKLTQSKRVRVAKFVQDTWNRLTVQWSDMNVAPQCLGELVKKTGGELAFDTVNRRIYHQPTVGENLETEEIIRLQQGVNVSKCKVREARVKIYNRLTLLGYGEGVTRLRVTVDARGLVGGETSQDVYGVQHGVYSDPDITDWYVGYLDCQDKVEQLAWPAVSYDVTVLDEAAAHLCPGDYVRLIYDDIDTVLRILEIERSNDGSPAHLVVGDRVGTLAETIADIADQVDKLARK